MPGAATTGGAGHFSTLSTGIARALKSRRSLNRLAGLDRSNAFEVHSKAHDSENGRGRRVYPSPRKVNGLCAEHPGQHTRSPSGVRATASREKPQRWHRSSRQTNLRKPEHSRAAASSGSIKGQGTLHGKASARANSATGRAWGSKNHHSRAPASSGRIRAARAAQRGSGNR
jgi:hypothetical protein